ncbi:hypothetical protein ACFO4E_05030 [Nocardiopsis mangrovi]|uniref:Uncharacterized protein n=1 Tax=Nocardiopsis mangrovi TaxID=1179818 RepID=A0ABV9DS61_9ACTN
MIPSSPTRFRPSTPPRRIIAAAGIAAAALAGVPLAAVEPAGADPVAPGSGTHAATARMATVEWCDQGPIGDADTDRDGAESSAAWSGGPASGRHFPDGPAGGYGVAERGDTSLWAASAVHDLRFDPACSAAAAADGGTVADAFGAEHLVALDSAESTASWTRDEGAEAELAVRGLSILGEPADLGDGDYEQTFTRSREDGGTVLLTVTARQHAEADSDGPAASGGAAAAGAGAWLALTFQVTDTGPEKGTARYAEYRLDLAVAGVRTDRAAEPGPGPSGEPRSATPDPSESEPAEPSPPESAGPSPSPSPVPTPAVPAPPAGWSPSEAPQSRDGSLPVAGSALVGLVGAGIAAVAGGAAAIYLGRARKSGFDGDDV